MIRTQSRRALLLLLLAAATPARADLYRFVSATGETFYTEQESRHRSIREFVGSRGGARHYPFESGYLASNAGPFRRKETVRLDPTIEEYIERSARDHDLDPNLVRAIIQTESGYDPMAISHKGALGLMQLMPSTALDMGVSDPMDAAQNIAGGTRFLRKLLDQFDSDLELALAAYNSGEGNVKRYGRRIPPFAETQGYVLEVMQRYSHR